VGTLDVDQALGMFHETATNFAIQAGKDLPDLSQARDWLASDPGHRVPLVVMAASIHQVLTGQGGFGFGGPELIRELANIERDRAARVSQDAGLGVDGLSRLLSLAALTESGLSDQQCEALAELGVCESTGQGLIDRLKRTPWRRWRDDGQGFHLARPEPDRMAATFLALSLLDDPTHRLPEWLAEVAVPQGGGFSDVISRVGHDLLGMPLRWSSALEQALTKMILQDHDRAVLFLDVAEKEGTVFSAGFAVVISQQLLAVEGLDDDRRAGLLNNLSGFLGAMGRREDALKASQEAVTLFRQLADAHPEVSTSGLAASLHTLATSLFRLGRREDAFRASQEAVTLSRQLVETRPEAFTPGLALSLTTLANRLSDLGQCDNAHEAAQEAVTLSRQLAEACPEAFTDDLANSLNTLATSLSRLGRREDAREASQEAVTLYRQLAETRPDAFTPGLAQSLNNLANRLSDLGRHEDAREALQEAVTLRRQLASVRPEALTPHLAESLNNLAAALSHLGRHEDAHEVAREAVMLRRQLADTRPGAYTPELAGSLGNLANMLSNLDRHEDACEAGQEAVLLYRQLAAARPDAFTPELAESLTTLAAMLFDLGRPEDALNGVQEAVTLYRQLAEARPEAFTRDLAVALNNLATMLYDLGRGGDALNATREAVERMTPCFLRNPLGYAQLMASVVQRYLEHCEEIRNDPDLEMLSPALKLFEQLNEAQQRE
jgi:tetratricopeptide (TPR) repeat protein